MPRPRRLAALLALAGLCSAVPAAAQVLPFHVYGLDDGLPQSQVNDLAQDAEGFVWVATQGGLARFDGERFAPFFLGDGLTSNRTQELLVDRSGSLWVATVAGVSRWSDHRLSPVSHRLLDGVRCRALAEDASGAVWVGTDAGVVRGQGGAFARVGEEGLVAFDLWPDGRAVIAGTSRGVLRLGEDGSAALLVRPEAVGSDVRAVARAPEGLYVGTFNTGLWLLAGDQLQPVAGVSARVIQRVAVGRSGALYVATNDAGLFVKAPGREGFDHWTSRRGLPADIVSSALEDHEGNLWVGTDIGGLGRLSGTAVSTFGTREGLPDACVLAVAPDRVPGRLWVSTPRGAALLETGPVPRVVERAGTAEGLTNEQVWGVLPTPEGEVWVMTDNAFQVRARGARAFAMAPPVVQTPRSVPYDMQLDGAGRLWLARTDERGGLLVRDARGAWRVFSRTGDGRPVTACRRLFPRAAGGVWVADGMDVLWSDGESLQRVPGPVPLAHGSYLGALFEDRQGRLWAGSDVGLAVREAGGWRSLNDTPGFADRRVYFLGEDREGVTWVGTARGVYRFLPDGSVRPLGTEDGLPHLETNQGGFHVDASDGVWVGTVGGLTHFERSQLSPNPVPPRLVVESAEVPGRTVGFPRALDLAWAERSPAFRVAVLTFRGRPRAAYRARVEGVDADWLPLRRPGELRYTNLPPGRSELQLQAVNDAGVWGEVVRVPIRVAPPFWMTWWFRSGLGLLVLGAGLLGHRWRTLVLRRRNRELQDLVAARTAEIAAASRRLKEAQDQLARLLETSGQAQEDLEAWIRRAGAEIARAVGAEGVGAFVAAGDGPVAVGEPAGEPPSPDELERLSREGRLAEPGRLLLPVTGPNGSSHGALVVGGPPGAWDEAELQLFRGFAHQLGGALEMRGIRRSLSAIQTSRAALRQRLADEGVVTVAVCPACGACSDGSAPHCPRDGQRLDGRLLPYRIRGRYRLLRVLGEGGMGTVFVAEDEQLRREVAIKVVRPALLDNPDVRARFEREAQALAHIQHPAVLALFDSGALEDGSAFLITELLRGADVGAVLRRFGPAGPDQVAALLLQAAGALAAAHRVGVVHRDLKPQNLVLTPGSPFRVTLVDFGLAAQMSTTSGLTATGAVVGTPAYMAPEQVRGGTLSPRTDLYSLATVGYECLTNRPVVGARNLGEVFAEVLESVPAPPSLRRDGLGPAVDAAFAAALAKDPQARPADPEAWAQELAAALAAAPAEPRWPEGFLGEMEAERASGKVTTLRAAAVPEPPTQA